MLKMFHGLRPGRGSSYFIACSDAPAMHKLMADLVLTGTNDHTAINAFLLAKGAGDFLFSTGTIFTAGTISTQAANQRIRGAGRSTLFFATNSAGSNAPIISVVHGVCFLEDFAMDGNKANNAGRTSMRLISVTGVSSCRIRKIYGNGSAGNGFDLTGVITDTTLTDVVIQGSQVYNFNVTGAGGAGLGIILQNCIAFQSITSAGFFISGTDHHFVGCLAYGNATYGFLDQGTKTLIEGCHAYGNASYGIYLNGTAATVTGGLVHANGYGILMGASSTGTHISGVLVSENTANGIQHDTSAGPAIISGCLVRLNNGYGIYVNSDYCAIVGNYVHANSVAGAATYAGILTDGLADNCYIANNKVWRGASGNRHSYGIHINGGSNHFVGQNDLFEGGMTADYTESGTNIRRSTKVVLDYTAGTDLLNAFAATAGVAFNVTADQTFRVDSAIDEVTIQSRGGAYVIMGGATAEWATYLLVDGATTYRLTGGGQGTGTHGAFSFAGVVSITGLTVGNHTVRIVAISSQAATVYCRAATQPVYENAAIQVVEHAR